MDEDRKAQAGGLDDELALIERAQGGDRSAEEDLLRNYGNLIRRIAVRCWKNPDDLPDLLQEGKIALWQAIKRFDRQRGSSPSAFFASHIRYGIVEWIRVRMGIGFPPAEQRQRESIRRFIRKMTARLGRLPTNQELADELGVDMNQIMILISPEVVEFGPVDEQEIIIDTEDASPEAGWAGGSVPGETDSDDDPGTQEWIYTTDPERLARFRKWRSDCLSRIHDSVQQQLFLLRQGRLFEPGGPLTMEEAAKRLSIRVVDDARVLEALTLDLLEDERLILNTEDAM